MHSSEAAAPAGPGLLLQLGRLILRARTPPPGHKHRPGTSHQPHQVLIQTQPKLDEEDDRLEDAFRNHINALWTEHVPICVEVLLAPSCSECYTLGAEEPSFPMRGLMLERWTMRTVLDKSESPATISSPWLLNAVRSQLHFSQLAAWRARTQPHAHAHERRRKLSREINIKKIEANTDEVKLNVVYSIKAATDCTAAFAKPPTDHTFPLTDIGSGKYLKVVLESLPRLEEIPDVTCACRGNLNTEELVGRLNDLSIGSRKYDGAINSNIGTPSRRLSIITNPGSTEYLFTIDKDKLLDDRMHTPCSENGKHKCNCDDESDGKEKSQAKKLDERRIKEIAKYKRRIRKEVRKFCDSTSSEGEVKKETTSIPILQASRFDRFRAIGCYRNQTYLTLPANRIEAKSPFIDTDSITITPPECKTSSVATQTDFACTCGNPLQMKCANCVGMVRSDGNYNLASLQEYGTRRKLDDAHVDKSLKKQKCDNSVNNFSDGIIKRPRFRRFFPIVDKLEKIVTDRNHNAERDMQDLHLKTDDSVFSTVKESKNPPQSTDEELSVDKELNELPQRTAYQFSMDKELNGLPQRTADQFSMDKELNGLPQRTANQFSMDKELIGLPQRTANQFSMDNELNGSQQETAGQLSMNKEFNGSPQSTAGQLSMQKELNGSPQRTDDQLTTPKESKRQKTYSVSDDDYILYEKCDYGTIDRHEVESPKEEHPDFKFSIPEKSELNGKENLESLKDDFIFPCPNNEIPSPTEMDRFRWRFDSAASMVFHTKTGLPLTSSPAPLRRGNNCFDFDDSISDISGIKSALFHPISPVSPAPPASPASPASPVSPAPSRGKRDGKLKMGSSSGLLGSFEESALQGRLEAVATVQGFTAELGASGAFCPPHKRLPVTVFFYAPGGTAAPYMGHIKLGPGGYRVSRAGSVQVSLFNPHGTLVKMFVVLYDLSRMPPAARTFLRQRTLHRAPQACRLRYLIHLRFMTSKSGKLYLHTDIRLIVSRKADLDTAAAHSGLLRPLPRPGGEAEGGEEGERVNRAPNRVFGGSSELDSETSELGYDSASLSYDLRSFTYAPDNPKYSPR